MGNTDPNSAFARFVSVTQWLGEAIYYRFTRKKGFFTKKYRNDMTAIIESLPTNPDMPYAQDAANLLLRFSRKAKRFGEEANIAIASRLRLLAHYHPRNYNRVLGALHTPIEGKNLGVLVGNEQVRTEAIRSLDYLASTDPSRFVVVFDRVMTYLDGRVDEQSQYQKQLLASHLPILARTDQIAYFQLYLDWIGLNPENTTGRVVSIGNDGSEELERFPAIYGDLNRFERIDPKTDTVADLSGKPNDPTIRQSILSSLVSIYDSTDIGTLFDVIRDVHPTVSIVRSKRSYTNYAGFKREFRIDLTQYATDQTPYTWLTENLSKDERQNNAALVIIQANQGRNGLFPDDYAFTNVFREADPKYKKGLASSLGSITDLERYERLLKVCIEVNQPRDVRAAAISTLSSIADRDPDKYMELFETTSSQVKTEEETRALLSTLSSFIRNIDQNLGQASNSRSQFIRDYLALATDRDPATLIAELRPIVTCPTANFPQMNHYLESGLQSATEIFECSQVRLGSGFEVVSKLGSGGMMEVYKVRDFRGDEWAAKLFGAERMNYLLRETELSMPEFIRRSSLNTIANFKHPYICSLYIISDLDGNPVLIEELVEKTLEDMLYENTFSVQQITEYGAQIARALAFCHDFGVIHQDLKPNNLGYKNEHMMIFDFGLSTYDQPHHPSRREVGGLLIRPREQFEGYTPTPQVDIYALAVNLYRMVTGVYPVLLGSDHDESNLPFDPENGRPEFSQYLREKVADPAHYRTVIDHLSNFVDSSNPLFHTIKLGLSIDPNDRPKSMKELPILA